MQVNRNSSINYNNIIKLTRTTAKAYTYIYDPSCNPLLTTIAYYLTTYIGYSEYYKRSLNNKPYVYHINNSVIERVDNYILFGLDFGSFHDYISSEQFESMMIQWEEAFIKKPMEIFLTINENKNISITYQRRIHDKDSKIDITNKTNSIGHTNNKIQMPWFISTKDQFVEIAKKSNVYFINSKNEKLTMFAALLTNKILYKVAEKLNQSPFEYYNDRYYLTVVEDRILVYDKAMEIKSFPKFDKFIDLLERWQSALNQNPELIRLYIDDDYNFKIDIIK